MANDNFDNNDNFPFIFPLEGETERDYNKVMMAFGEAVNPLGICASAGVLAGQHIALLTIEDMINDPDTEIGKADALYLIQKMCDQMMNYVRDMPDNKQ